MVNIRRLFIQSSLLGISGLLTHLLNIKSSYATEKTEFNAKNLVTTLEQLFHGQSILASDRINIRLPTIAENGAVVPISINSDLDDIERIYILVENNPKPLTAEFYCSEKVVMQITARIKMAESSQVIVIAKTGSQLLQNQQWVNVVQGGCGTG